MKPWVAAALALCLSSPALSDDVAYRGLTAAEVKQALERGGFPARLQKVRNKPVVWSRIGDTSFGVFFFSCTEDAEPRCGEIQFYAGFQVRGLFPTVLINEWNKTRRFARAYIDGDHNAVLEMDLDATGTTDIQLSDALEWWKVLVPEFEDFLEQSTRKTS